ncbi:patatin-like phospholipase domain-containing protein 2 [Oncorhynchus masou masou]|uniref:patatin-like phospholipase domain-containing protein 2 n=1 Tax=Oncorhynchus masou masou TaxID=90313 RepID=UPI0031843CBF
MSPAKSSGQSDAVQSLSSGKSVASQFIASQSMEPLPRWQSVSGHSVDVQSVDGQSLSTGHLMESLSTGQQYTSVPSLSSPLMAGQSEPSPLSISFSASGFQATYQLGVAQSMLDLAPLVLQAAPKVMGASAGSLVAAALVCGSSLDMVRNEMLRFALQSRGPLHLARNVFVWIEGLLRRSLPDDAHIRANGRLAVVLTRIPDGQNTVVSEFTSREDVVQALLCSCFIPGYHGIQPPSYKGVYYVDGGMSSIQPTHSSPYAHTLTVSPFAGEADICPPDPGSMYVIVMSGMPLNCSVANGYRILDALYPYNLEVGTQNNPYSPHPALYPSTHSPSSPPSLLPLHPALYLSD